MYIWYVYNLCILHLLFGGCCCWIGCFILTYWSITSASIFFDCGSRSCMAIALMMTVSTSEKSINFYQTTWRNIPEDSRLQGLSSVLTRSIGISRNQFSCFGDEISGNTRGRKDGRMSPIFCHFVHVVRKTHNIDKCNCIENDVRTWSSNVLSVSNQYFGMLQSWAKSIPPAEGNTFVCLIGWMWR
jgi:hypothetical protein